MGNTAQVLGIEKLILDDEDFDFFRKLLFSKTGITPRDNKKDLFQNRLRGRITDLGLRDFSDYKRYLQESSDSDPEWQLFINQLTTNTTNFFREPKHFDFLIKSIAPTWAMDSTRNLKIWSAASSTGEEAYSISMVLANYLPRANYEILATDIDTNVLKKARNAVYSSGCLKNVPSNFQFAFNSGTGDLVDWVRIKPRIKGKVTFKQFNITSSPIGKEVYDIIFCRNLLIYFSAETIERVIDMLYASTRENGFLFIGHSESLHNIKHRWKQVAPSIYQKTT